MVLNEFTEVAVEASTALLGGVTYTKNRVGKVRGGLSGVGYHQPGGTRDGAGWRRCKQIIDLDTRQLFNLLKHEPAADHRADRQLSHSRQDFRKS